MLEFVDVSVLHNKTSIIYMVTIPELEPANYGNLYVKPKIHLEINENCVSNNVILALPRDCKNSNQIIICKKDRIVYLSESKCISKLVQGKEALSDYSNADTIDAIDKENSRMKPQIPRIQITS